MFQWVFIRQFALSSSRQSWSEVYQRLIPSIIILQSSLIGIVIPAEEVVVRWASNQGICGTFVELCENPKVKEMLLKEILAEGKASELHSFEQVRCLFRLITTVKLLEIDHLQKNFQFWRDFSIWFSILRPFLEIFSFFWSYSRLFRSMFAVFCSFLSFPVFHIFLFHLINYSFNHSFIQDSFVILFDRCALNCQST